LYIVCAGGAIGGRYKQCAKSLYPTLEVQTMYKELLSKSTPYAGATYSWFRKCKLYIFCAVLKLNSSDFGWEKSSFKVFLLRK